jgi:hypothetical protein
LLFAARRWLGGWPDLWRARRLVLPVADRLADGRYDDELKAVEGAVGIDATTAANALPEKTGMPLQEREFAGVLDTPPAQVREEFRSMSGVWAATLASIQYESVDGERVWEVGSYAFRPEGFLGERQVHVRLTSRGSGDRTALWAHRELNPWRRPRDHYRSLGWTASAGVAWVLREFGDDERFSGV